MSVQNRALCKDCSAMKRFVFLAINYDRYWNHTGFPVIIYRCSLLIANPFLHLVLRRDKVHILSVTPTSLHTFLSLASPFVRYPRSLLLPYHSYLSLLTSSHSFNRYLLLTMKATVYTGALSIVLGYAVAAPAPQSSLIVSEAPQTVKPYVLRKLSGASVAVGEQIYRFSVTGNSSGGAYTLMQTNAPASNALGVLPHLHKTHYENFYCTKGRVSVWAKTNAEQGRVLTQGDYGAVPPNAVHTFQMLDPDTQLTGVIQPGGFEKLFFTIGDPSFRTSTGSPFVPSAAKPGVDPGANPGMIAALQGLDVFASFDFKPTQSFVNGAVGSGNASWHDGKNVLAQDEKTPNFVAKNYGPKYLNTENGYKIIAPLATGKQSADKFTMGTITMSPLLANTTNNPTTLSQHVAFQLEEGQLVVGINGETVTLIDGDVVFIPSGTAFTYYAAVPFTKFLYVSAGGNGLDAQLIQKSIPWEYASYPVHAGFVGH
jgi:quercetin dioxygenase-like cupin family protein